MLASCNKILFFFYSTAGCVTHYLSGFVGSGCAPLHSQGGSLTPAVQPGAIERGSPGHCGKKTDMALHDSVKSLPVCFSFSPSKFVKEKVSDWF